MQSVGVDVVELSRVAKVLHQHGERFLERIYTASEVAYCRGRLRELAARFAGKEAVAKALGTGLRGVSWREIEILPDPQGKPLVFLHGRARQRAEELGFADIAISLTHGNDVAIAVAVGYTEDPGPSPHHPDAPVRR